MFASPAPALMMSLPSPLLIVVGTAMVLAMKMRSFPLPPMILISFSAPAADFQQLARGIGADVLAI